MSFHSNGFEVTSIPAFSDNYIWLLTTPDNKAIVVDPGEAEPVRRVLAERQLVLTDILLTHHHADHTGGVAELVDTGDVAVHAPFDERIRDVTRRLADGDTLTLGDGARARVMAVPGHTSSHIAFSLDELLFCGDTLFSLGCGRVFEGTMAQMLTSLDTLAALPDATRVCCAHEYTLANARFAVSVDPDNRALQQFVRGVEAMREAGQPSVPSLLGDEKACNPFLRVDAPAIKAWAGSTDDTPDARVARFAALRTAKDQF